MAALVSCVLPAGAGQAEPLDPLTTLFAGCAGRLSAHMEHQWLMSDPDADRTKAQRDAMVALVQAAAETRQATAALHHRIAAKHAHAMLLRRATFERRDAGADWARRKADGEIANCLGLLLG